MAVPVPINTDLERRIADAFLIFDHLGDKSVDVREIGTILRYLGCVPTENEINQVIINTEFENASGSVHLSRFLPHVCELLAERKMEPATPEKLLQAFQALDPDNVGYLTKDFIMKMMTEEGEPFTQEELEEMLTVAVDPETGNIPYECYLNQLMIYL